MSLSFFKKESGALGSGLTIYRIETVVWAWDLQIAGLYSFCNFTYPLEVAILTTQSPIRFSWQRKKTRKPFFQSLWGITSCKYLSLRRKLP